MTQLGPWAISHAIDLILGKSSDESDRQRRDEAFAWGRPQRFSVGRIVDDQRRSLRGHVDVITVGRPPSQKGASGATQRI